jgi:hypothetical protein
MTKQEFIAFYGGGTLDQYKTGDGFTVGSNKRFALPCNCGEDLCLGWAMVRESEIEDHKRRFVTDEEERKE